eukprot:CAMPEP_0197538336 /NCGR_PEP_ID=MMETSP1318-20131121/59549_1 /TAXON_ID=552666 /ORGANISM="Partenskyella glossopodia, Strain RCC365" /LENGTH=605 /DNA_ID=CAMNT_0043096727 /DNA_START=234 /DNA_END=2051 /DNA_ORIENTATION=-
MEMCERLCFYGLTGSIKVLFQSRFGYTSFQASALTNVLPSFVYLTPLMGGYIADEFWGRFKTITIFGSVYLLSVALMAFSVYPGYTSKNLFMLSCFGLLSLGTGGIKANVVTLGGDQFDDRNPAHKEQKEQFFNYFYWAINFGAMISFGYLAQMATNGSGAIPPEYGFFWSFVICGSALFIALCSFLGASGRYILNPAAGGTMGNFKRVFMVSLKHTWTAWFVLLGVILMCAGFVLSVAGAFIENDSLNKIIAVVGCVCASAGVLMTAVATINTDWVGYTPEFVEAQYEQLESKATDPASASDSVNEDIVNARDLWRVMPPVLCSTSFWVAYNQMSSNFYSQSCQMDLRVGGSQLNAAILNIADCLTIMICIPLFDAFLYPFIERCKGSKFTLLQKMACGFLIGTVALVSAAVIEVYRKDSGVLDYTSDNASYSNCGPIYSDDNPNTCEEDANGFLGKKTCMSKMSVFWMAIPYCLIGIGECLISVQVYELCYSEIPLEMRSTAQAINLFTTSLASAIAAGLTIAWQSEIPDDLNNGYLEYMYYSIAGLQFVTFIFFVYATRNFEYKEAVTEGFHAVLEGGSADRKSLSYFEDEIDGKDAEIVQG